VRGRLLPERTHLLLLLLLLLLVLLLLHVSLVLERLVRVRLGRRLGRLVRVLMEGPHALVVPVLVLQVGRIWRHPAPYPCAANLSALGAYRGCLLPSAGPPFLLSRGAFPALP